jgi:hypothetical protein
VSVKDSEQMRKSSANSSSCWSGLDDWDNVGSLRPESPVGVPVHIPTLTISKPDIPVIVQKLTAIGNIAVSKTSITHKSVYETVNIENQPMVDINVFCEARHHCCNSISGT